MGFADHHRVDEFFNAGGERLDVHEIIITLLVLAGEESVGKLSAGKGNKLVVVGLHFGRVGVESVATIDVVAKFFFAAAEFF